MNWERELIRYYDQMADRAGEYQIDPRGYSYALLPIRHTSVSANLEIFLDLDGNFLKVEPIAPEDAFTITGTTEDAIARSSNQAAHLICDNLGYMAGDILDYYKPISTNGKDNSSLTVLKHQACVKQLEDTVAHKNADGYEDAPESLRAICAYIKKGTMVHDLLSDERKEITEVVIKGSNFKCDTKVRFRVLGADVEETWKDHALFQFWQKYCQDVERSERKVFSILTGSSQTICRKTGTGILGDADTSKLFSSNISDEFVGRFLNASDFVTIGRDDDAKIYAALKYLLKTTGRNLEGFYSVVWDSQHHSRDSWMSDTYGYLSRNIVNTREQTVSEMQVTDYLAENGVLIKTEASEDEVAKTEQKIFVEQIDQMIKHAEERDTSQSEDSPVKVYIMGLRKNYPGKSKGRISVVDFQELPETIYLRNIRKWHTEGCWMQPRTHKANAAAFFYGMPGIRDMADLLFGVDSSDGLHLMRSKSPNTVVSFFYQQIMHCILYGDAVPTQYVELAANRARNPLAFKKQRDYERVLSLACSFVAKQKKIGDETMLRDDYTDRSYLFGRLMAVADRVERRTFDPINDANRRTNSEKNMSSLAAMPGRTWNEVAIRLNPYFAKLHLPERLYYKKLIDSIMDKFTPEDFSNKPLTHMYLLGYSAQNMERQSPTTKVTGLPGDSN